MYSVFLVEDESVIREGIKSLIAWEDYGFTFAGEAADGELAWPLIQKLRPDIVITDIKMPFLDGLALSRLIRKELPKTTIIILSGYDDFSYAKEAISIGVSEYLLKPLSRTQLTEALAQIRTQREEAERQSHYMAQFHTEVQEYLSSSRRGFFDLLISGRMSVSQILDRAQRLGLDLAAPSYNIVLFLLEEDPLHTEYSASLADVQEEICRRFPENENLLLFSIGVDLLVFLIKGETADIGRLTESCVESLREICKTAEQSVDWSVVVGEPVHRLSSVTGCYRTVRRAMMHRDTGSPNRVVRVGQTTEPYAVDFDPNNLDAAKMDQRIVSKFLINGHRDDMDSFVEDYFDSFDPEGVRSLLFRQYVVLNIQFTVNAYLKNLGCPAAAGGRDLARALTTLNETKRYVRDLLLSALSARDTAVSRQYRQTLQKALSYMEEHYADPAICLNAVAKVARVSATHFSAMFSQQMGKTFVEHLTDLRMEKAKELLRFTNENSSEIAYQVGYNDPHYFSFLFKKTNGCTPRDYRNGKNQVS